MGNYFDNDEPKKWEGLIAAIRARYSRNSLSIINDNDLETFDKQYVTELINLLKADPVDVEKVGFMLKKHYDGQFFNNYITSLAKIVKNIENGTDKDKQANLRAIFTGFLHDPDCIGDLHSNLFLYQDDIGEVFLSEYVRQLTQDKSFVEEREKFYDYFYTVFNAAYDEPQKSEFHGLEGKRPHGKEQELHWEEEIYNVIAERHKLLKRPASLVSMMKEVDTSFASRMECIMSHIQNYTEFAKKYSTVTFEHEVIRICSSSAVKRLTEDQVQAIITSMAENYQPADIIDFIKKTKQQLTIPAESWPTDKTGLALLKQALITVGLAEVFTDKSYGAIIPESIEKQAKETLNKYLALIEKNSLDNKEKPIEKPNKPEEKNPFLDQANKAKFDGDFNELLTDRDLIHLTKEQAAKACKPQREAKELGLLELRFLAKLRKKCKERGLKISRSGGFLGFFKGDTEAEQKQNMNAYFEERFQERDRARDAVYKAMMEGIEGGISGASKSLV